MDIGAQTLAQLSQENKDEKFVTLETGSKISGYTKDYLERLCKLNKVIYRLWTNGAFVIELESLLKETQTLLLSYEGITFVDKKELTMPVSQIAAAPSSLAPSVSASAPMPTTNATLSKEEVSAFASGKAQPVPRFGGDALGDSAFSFIGRSVVSKPQQNEVAIPHVYVPVINKAPVAAQVSPEIKPVEKPSHEPVHISVTRTEAAPVAKTYAAPNSPVASISMLGVGDTPRASISPAAPPIAPIATIPHKPEIKAVAQSEIPDAWDQLLLGAHGGATPAAEIPAPPVEQKSVSFRPDEFPGGAVASAPISLPRMRVMQQIVPGANLPAKPDEHHLTILESHPLSKSPGFNVVAIFVVSSFIFLGGAVAGNFGGKINNVLYVAGVGAVGDQRAFSNEEYMPPTTPRAHTTTQEELDSMLPFSNEIVVSPGEAPNSVIVQPVFNDGVGRAYEYALVPIDRVASSTRDSENGELLR